MPPIVLYAPGADSTRGFYVNTCPKRATARSPREPRWRIRVAEAGLGELNITDWPPFLESNSGRRAEQREKSEAMWFWTVGTFGSSVERMRSGHQQRPKRGRDEPHRPRKHRTLPRHRGVPRQRGT